ncbi:peptide chain release factor-like protein [bacterium]|nr:peptide chain release factor-like protein [bacterium]
MKQNEIEFFFYKSRGPGGQRKNKKETSVKVVHIPTGLTARATEYTSQARNREKALKRLIEKIRISKQVKKKRISTRKPKYVREKELRNKRLTSEKKKLRKKVDVKDVE